MSNFPTVVTSGDNPRSLQPFNLLPVHAQHFRQDVLRVLAQRGRRGPHPGLALRVLDGRTDEFDLTTSVVVDLGHHPPGADVGVVQGVLDVVDGGVRHPAPLENLQPLGRRFLGGEVLDHPLQDVAVLDPHVVGHEARVRLPLRPAQFVADDPKQPVVAAAQHDVAVAGLEALVRHDGRVRRAPPPAVALPADQDAAGDVGQGRHLAVGEGHVEVLAGVGALSSQQGRHDGVARVQSRGEVGDGDADLDGRSVSFSRDVHQAHFRLDHDVVTGTRRVGTRLAVPGDGGVD